METETQLALGKGEEQSVGVWWGCVLGKGLTERANEGGYSQVGWAGWAGQGFCGARQWGLGCQWLVEERALGTGWGDFVVLAEEGIVVMYAAGEGTVVDGAPLGWRREEQ